MAIEILLVGVRLPHPTPSPERPRLTLAEIFRTRVPRLPAAEWMMYETPFHFEALFVTEDLPTTRSAAFRFFNDLFPNLSADKALFLTGGEAVRHYFHVLLGLDTPWPGNILFLENLKEGYTLCLENGMTGAILNRLFQTSVTFYRKAQKESPVLQGADSLPEVILELAQKIFGETKNQRFLIWGNANETMAVRRFLRNRDISFVDATSGTPLGDFDIFIRFSEHALASDFKERLALRLKNRPYKPILFVDLSPQPMAVPKGEALLFYSRDDLKTIIQHHYTERQKAAETLRPKIEQTVKNFLSWFYARERFEFSGIIGRSRPLVRVLEMVARVSASDVTVLIEGESGTGKELIAKAIHRNSLRAKKPFVVVNSAAIPDTLLESELFGHVKGAFSGAVFSKKGLFEEADHGTIFMDEIGEMSPSTQAKILRVLQNGEIRRVGSTTTVHVDVRLIAATNKNLAERVREGLFREDLYYRLKVLHIVVPPLRERSEDVEELAYSFLERYGRKLGKHLTTISPEAMALLKAYPWPGNVRELENAVERAVVMTMGRRITSTDLPQEIQFFSPSAQTSGSRWPTLQELEKQHILRTLNHVDWNLGRATELLGISRATLWRKLKAYGIQSTKSA